MQQSKANLELTGPFSCAAVPKPLLPEFVVYHRLESCDLYAYFQINQSNNDSFYEFRFKRGSFAHQSPAMFHVISFSLQMLINGCFSFKNRLTVPWDLPIDLGARRVVSPREPLSEATRSFKTQLFWELQQNTESQQPRYVQ